MSNKPTNVDRDDQEAGEASLLPAQQMSLARQAQGHLSQEWLVNEFGDQHPVILDALQQFIERAEQARNVEQAAQKVPLHKQRLVQGAFRGLLASAAHYQARNREWDVVRREEEQSRPAWRQHANYTPPQEQVRLAWLKALDNFRKAKLEFINVSDTVGLEALSVLLGSLSPMSQQVESDVSRLDMAEVGWVLAALLDIAEIEELNTSSDEEDHLARLKTVMERGRKLLVQVEEIRKVPPAPLQ